jgi:hypothetical protein
MKNFGLFLLLVLAAAIMLACGSQPPIASNCGSTTTATNDGMPQSISVCPATADAASYPGGQVPFIATGNFNSGPTPVTPLKVQVWGVCQQNSPTSDVSITSSGVAQCQAGASGTYQVFASDETNCLAIGPCGNGCYVTGRAQLTCP